MIDFDFLLKTKIYFGKDKELLTGKILKQYGATKVLIVYGGGSIKKTGLYDRVITSLKEENISYCELSDIRPNPTRSQAQCGVYIAKENNIDFILAIGGGSVMDCAKSIAAGYYYDGDVFDFNLHKIQPQKCLPVGVILTISASGSELSTSCVISNDATNIKQGFNSELNRPVFAIENPELTYSVSPYQTACGIVDILSHTLERYFSISDDGSLTDELSIGLLKNVIENGKKACKKPLDYYARANLMLASSLSHCDLTNLGKTKSMPIHAMEHVISGVHENIAHGAGLSVLIPIWMNAVVDFEIDKYCELNKRIFNVNVAISKENAIIFINYLKNFFKEIGMPTSLSELGISKEEVVDLADKMTGNGTRVVGHTVKPLTKEEIVKAMLDYGY